MAAEWTFAENKISEHALAKLDISSPNFFENLASRIPTKTVQDIIMHYQALVDDVEMMEAGQIPVPDYADDYDEVEVEDDDVELEEENKKDGDHENQDGGSLSAAQKEYKTRSKGKKLQRQKSVSWTEEEHQLFLMGLNKYGKGEWKSISKYYVITKTPTQVASHAQKFYRRQMTKTPLKKRRPSIHDIQTVNPIPTIMDNSSASIPNKAPKISVPIAANNLLLNMPNFTAFAASVNPNPMLLNANSNEPSFNPNPMFLNPTFNGSAAIDPIPVFTNFNFNGSVAIDPNPMYVNPTFNGSASIDPNSINLNSNFNGSAATDPNPIFLNPNFLGATAIHPNNNFLYMPSSTLSTFPSAADFNNYQCTFLAGPSAASFRFPAYGNNQPWG